MPAMQPLSGYVPRSDDDILARARAFYDRVRSRRTVREYSDRPVPRAVIETCLLAAGTAPNGANLQPWHFVAVTDPDVKRRIREAAEAEERAFYRERAPDAWLEALAPLGTDEHKPFLETAPVLIAVFVQPYAVLADGTRRKHYYATESTGIATGLLVTALHEAGLVCLTHTPSPMAFLGEILGRPAHERPFVLLVAGHPAEGARVPSIDKKPLEEIASFV
ncbi:MAG TPA: nitroreductase family protein [Trueperaceae bacterium]|nr:nitroreductase family protein [Trueperaceae bacterium]